MNTPVSDRFRHHPDMPLHIRAHVTDSNFPDLLRLANDHRLQLRTLKAQAIKELEPVVNWFIKAGKPSEGIEWLRLNAPDALSNIRFISILGEAEDKLNPNGLP